MSLAMFAASIDDNSNITIPNNMENSDNIINQKRHKKTQRKYPKIDNFDTNKVNSILQKIHDNLDEDDDDKDTFNPPPKPESSGVQKTIPKTENFNNMDFPLGNTLGKYPQPNYVGDNDLELNNYDNYGDKKTIEEYYKRVIPGYKNNTNRPYYNIKNNDSYEQPTQDVLLKKLNYMISLLEEQQDEKTNNVTEEVILYSFLGIFIIFIADTFVRVGKYVR
jgi:hypothetical protein